nr:hypothetical protein [uncultured Campylobacter sp.]
MKRSLAKILWNFDAPYSNVWQSTKAYLPDYAAAQHKIPLYTRTKAS